MTVLARVRLMVAVWIMPPVDLNKPYRLILTRQGKLYQKQVREWEELA